MSIDTDDWEIISKTPASANAADPSLTVYADGTGRLNAEADRLLDCPEAVCYLTPPDGGRIAIAVAADDLPSLQRYKVTRNEEAAGGDVRPRSALERVGVDVNALEETNHLPLELTDDDVLVADVTDLLTAATHTDSDRASDPTPAADDDQYETFVCEPCSYEFDDEDVYEGHMNDVHGEGDDTEESADDDQDGTDVEFACRYDDCDFTSDSERGRNIHEGQTHEDEELASDDHGDTEVPDADDAPSPETVRDCAEQVGTVQDLADLLDLTTGEARFAARDADVYDGLQDNPPRPGVSRE